MTKLLLIRHGESEANNGGFFAGQYDAALMPRGLKQAQKTAAYIVEKYDVAKVYASDLQRAYCTALPIAKLLGIDVIPHRGLREIYAGKWQQKTFNALQQEFSDSYRVWLTDIGNAQCDGGESVKELCQRVMETLTQIAVDNDGLTVAVATHATPIRAAQTMIERASPDEMKSVPWVSNGSVTVIEYDGSWKCVSVSEDQHLGCDKTKFPANV